MKTLLRIAMIAVVTAISYVVITYVLQFLFGLFAPSLFGWLVGLISWNMPWGGTVSLFKAVLGLSCFAEAMYLTKNM